MQLSSKLIQKYNVSGPRYTSYPTALEFNNDFTAKQYLQALSGTQHKTLSLYIHIPFCSNICYYCACNKVITKDKSKADEYIHYLLKEAEMVAANSHSTKLGQIHFGGGTPTFLNVQQLAQIMDNLAKLFEISEDAEISIELDPRTLEPAELIQLYDMGFNRISIGIQDFDSKVQKAINRQNDFQSVSKLVKQARGSYFDSINMDLIYGLPHQTTETFSATVGKIVELKPERIALYNYAHLPHRFKPQRKINSADLPSPEQKIAIFEQTMNQLIDAGYVYIGMDHFALPDDGLNIAQTKGKLHRNFQGYTTHKDHELVGIGVSSISNVNNRYSQNVTDLPSYYQMLKSNQLPIWRGCQLSDDDVLRRDVIMELICNFKLDIAEIEKNYCINFNSYFKFELNQLQEFIYDNLISINQKSISVTENGRYFIRNICMIFDSYLKEINQLQAYSRVI